MLHSELPSKPATYYERDRPVNDKQERLIMFCKDWQLPAPTYRYTRSRSRGEHGGGLHSSVVVNDIEYSSTLAAGSSMHPGWMSKNDAREAVAGEVLRVLGIDTDEGLPLILEE